MMPAGELSTAMWSSDHMRSVVDRVEADEADQPALVGQRHHQDRAGARRVQDPPFAAEVGAGRRPRGCRSVSRSRSRPSQFGSAARLIPPHVAGLRVDAVGQPGVRWSTVRRPRRPGRRTPGRPGRTSRCRPARRRCSRRSRGRSVDERRGDPDQQVLEGQPLAEGVERLLRWFGADRGPVPTTPSVSVTPGGEATTEATAREARPRLRRRPERWALPR